jgi:iron complex outermembrane receptor protein
MLITTTINGRARNRWRVRLGILTFVTANAVFCAVADAAEDASAGAGGNGQIQEIVVTGKYEFLSADTSGTTNLPLPIEKVPQSISLVSDDFIKAADLKTLGDIAEYTPGALNVGNEEGFGTIIKLRGFLAGQSLDGMNIGVAGGGAAFEPDYAVMNRLEIVKGPSSVVYGISSAGGLVNFVTKSATPQTPDYMSVQVGNWNNFRVEGQVAGALDPSQSLRGIAIAVRDQGDSFMNSVSHDTTVVYGGLNWNGSDAISAYVHGGFEQHIRTAFDGIPTEADGSPAPVPRSFFIGAEDMKVYTDVFHAEGDLTWHVNDMLDLSLKGNVRRVRSHGNAPYSFGLDQSGNLGIAIQQFEDGETNGVGMSAIYHLDSLGLHNSFLSLAALYQVDCSCVIGGQGVFTGAYASNQGPNVGTVNIFSGQAAIEAAFNSATIAPPSFFNDEWAKTLTISAQSFTQVFDHLSILAGASYADPKLTSISNGAIQDFDPGSQISYRAGLIGELAPGANAYLSFSQSFNPQSNIDINGNVLPPITSEQYEAGFKYRVAGDRILLSAAVFQIKQKNQGEFFTQIDGFDRYEPVGELTHKGLELQGLGSISREWQVNVGYTYLDPKVSKDSDPTIVGKTELFLPRQTASLFSTYNFNSGAVSGLSIGGGIRYVASEQTAYDGSSQAIPAYTVADASVGYSVRDWSLQLNLHNLGNKRYFINNYDTTFYGNVIGEPFHVALTLRRDF